jgi:hypothetical protein
MQLMLMLVVLQQAPPSPASVAGLLDGVPGRTSATTVPVVTNVEGVNVTQSSCTSKASIDELNAHFAKRFAKQGLYLPPEQKDWQPEAGTQLTGLDPENLVSYTVMLQPAGKAVTVLIAAADLGAKKLGETAEPVAPAMPGATGLTSYRLEGITAMSYAVRATPVEIKAFYRETLKKGGWVETGGLAFVKDGQQLTVEVSPGVSERYVMVQLQRAREE